jgi:hypothetical protein
MRKIMATTTTTTMTTTWYCQLLHGESPSDQAFCTVGGPLLWPDHLYTDSFLLAPHSLTNCSIMAAAWADLTWISPQCGSLCEEPLTLWCSVTSQETGTAVIITKETTISSVLGDARTHTRACKYIPYTRVCVFSSFWNRGPKGLGYSLSMSGYNHDSYKVCDSLSKIVITFLYVADIHCWRLYSFSVQTVNRTSESDVCWISKCLKPTKLLSDQLSEYTVWCRRQDWPLTCAVCVILLTNTALSHGLLHLDSSGAPHMIKEMHCNEKTQQAHDTFCIEFANSETATVRVELGHCACNIFVTSQRSEVINKFAASYLNTQG